MAGAHTPQVSFPMPLLSDQVRDRIPWVQLGVESVLVVLSVLFALTLDAWYNHTQEQERVRRALRGIHAELVENKKSLAFRVSHHRPMVDTFMTDSLSFRQPISLRLIDVNTQAWETAQHMGAVGLMNYEMASHISSVYAGVADLEYWSKRAFDVMMDGTTFLGYTPEKLGDFGGLLNELTRTEVKTLRRTERAIDVIEARMPAEVVAPQSRPPDSASPSSRMQARD